MPPAAEVLSAVRLLYVAGARDDLFPLAESAWRSAQHEADRHELALLGEVMRIASLAARARAEDGTSQVWLCRARALFAAAGSPTGLASSMLVDLYEVIDRHGPGPVALSMLDAIESCMGKSEDPVPSRPVLALIAEKRAFVLTEAASQAGAGTPGSSLDAARAEYERAAELDPTDVRRRLKIRAAVVTVDLLAGAIDTSEAISRLEAVLRDAEDSRDNVGDIAPIVAENLNRLRSGSGRLASYEPV